MVVKTKATTKKRPNQVGAWMPNMIDQVTAHEERYKAWRAANEFAGIPLVGKQFLKYVLGSDFPRPLYAHQKEAIVRTIFAYEILDYKDILLNVVTGGGKTLIIAALAAYMRVVHDIQVALLIAPNTIVRDRLKKDFDPASPDFVYKKFPFYFNSHSYIASQIQATILSSALHGSMRHTPEQIRAANVIVANVQQLYEGMPNLSVLESGIGKMVIFNDEAHNAVAPEWAKVIERLSASKQRVLRVDTTATPERLDGQNPGSNKVYDYRVKDALRDRVIKQIVVVQPDVVSVEYEVYEIDEQTGTRRTLSVEEVPWEELEKRRAAKEFSTRQYITSDKTIRPLAAMAYDALRLQRASAIGQGWQPILFVVAISIEDAKNIQKILQDREFAKRFNEGRPYRVHLVTEKSEEEDRAIVMRLGDDPEHPEVDVVVSVAMLREGWDVKNVGVILLLRRFTCRWVDGRAMSTFGPQTIGRGLRRIKPAALTTEWERCLVVDHPILDHQWLWDELGADVVSKRFEPGQSISTDDLPEQPPLIETAPVEVENPSSGDETIIDIDLPDPVPIEPMAGWKKYLQGKEYEKTGTKVSEKYRGIKQRTLDPKRGGMTSLSKGDMPELNLETPSADTSRICPDAPTCHELIYDEIGNIAINASREFGGGKSAYRLFHSVIENHIMEKLFGKKNIRDEQNVDRLEVILRHFLPQIREVFEDPSLLHGIWLDATNKK